MSFHSLQIVKVVSETADTKSIYFDIPLHLKELFSHKAGQYLTIKSSIQGEELRRAYSICTPPDSIHPGVTIKKTRTGKMSVYLHDKVKEGDFLDVMVPQGHFTLDPDHQKACSYYFIAAGSGITPIMSMIQSTIELEPKSTIYLLYGNRNEDSIIFQELLSQLETKYRNQLHVTHILSQPKEIKVGGIGGLFSKKVIEWKGLKGRINQATIKTFLDENSGQNVDKQYFICGPGDFIERTETTLHALNIDKKHIHKEYFTTTNNASTSTTTGLSTATVQVTLRGETLDIEVAKGKTILDVLIDKKKDPPYSCTSGACSTCMAKVTEGKVSMDNCYALDEDEVAAGYILTCQAHPQTPKVVLTYDV
jgi:ring-1,2-phenylacetyl-CoA epoxidase subunit PaaE